MFSSRPPWQQADPSRQRDSYSPALSDTSRAKPDQSASSRPLATVAVSRSWIKLAGGIDGLLSEHVLYWDADRSGEKVSLHRMNMEDESETMSEPPTSTRLLHSRRPRIGSRSRDH